MRATLPAVLLAALLALPAGTAGAASIAVTDPATFVGPNGPNVVDLRYRISNTNWDQAAIPGGTPTPTMSQQNIANTAGLNGRTFSFVATHAAGTGFAFRLFGGGYDRTVTFASTAAFNAILLSVRAQQDGSGIRVSDIAFAWGAGLTGPAAVPDLVRGENQGFLNLWLASRASLAGHDWQITGKVRGLKVHTGGDELVRFDIGARNVTLPAPVPLPAAAPLLLAGLAALGLLARRRPAARSRT